MNSKTAILLIEDDEDDALLMMRALGKAGIGDRVHVARDGQEALDYLSGAGKYGDRQQYPMPAIAFLDLKLPKVPGLEVLRRLREIPETKTLIIIVLTSSNLPADINQAYHWGANSYVVKPAAFEQLIEFTESFKRYWLNFNSAVPRNDSPSG